MLKNTVFKRFCHIYVYYYWKKMLMSHTIINIYLTPNFHRSTAASSLSIARNCIWRRLTLTLYQQFSMLSLWLIMIYTVFYSFKVVITSEIVIRGSVYIVSLSETHDARICMYIIISPLSSNTYTYNPS